MNREVVSITNPTEIPAVAEIIHDCWFDVDDISLDPATSTLSIRFTRESFERAKVQRRFLLKKVELPVLECLLKVHHVKSYRVNDTEQVGTYNFDDIEYDPRLKRVSITTGIPFDIKIFVTAFELTVEETGRVVDKKLFTSLFG